MSDMKKGKNRTQPTRSKELGTGHRPMRGGLLSQLASAFRLRQVVTKENPDVAEGTARHGLNDQRDIGRERHVMLLRGAVDELFTEDYLGARGLSRGEATKHNDVVTQALDVVLTGWDRLAIVSNVLPDHPDPIGGMVGLATGLSVELSLRLAAYDALHGYLHPFLVEIPLWLRRGPKLRGWWESIERRARREIKVSLLGEGAELDSHTVRDIRDGKTLPKEGTLPVLARRLATHAVRDHQEERDAQPAELEFELRVAVAAAEHPLIVNRVLTRRADDGVGMPLHVLRDILGVLGDDVSEDLLRLGTHARSWPRVEEAFRSVLADQVVAMAREAKADADRNAVMRRTNPAQALRDLAAQCAQQAAHLRSLDPRPGADGPEKRLAEHFEFERNVALAAATNGGHEVPSRRPEWSAEIKADGLCQEAIAPWLGLSAQDKEQRLREAVRVCGWSAYAHRCLARHVQGAGRFDEAIRLYRRSVELNPDNEGGRVTLVMLLADRGAHAEVLALTEHEQSSSMLRSARAHALFKLGDADAAEKMAREILEVNPRHTVALRVVGECLRAAGDEKGAREHERKADFFERGVGPPGA